MVVTSEVLTHSSDDQCQDNYENMASSFEKMHKMQKKPTDYILQSI